MDKTSSDEKLLKIIESTQGAKRAQKVGIKPKLKGKSPFPFKLRFRLKFNLAYLNKAVYGICGILTLFFLYSMINGTRIINKESEIPGGTGSSFFAKLITEGQSVFLSRDEYLEEIKTRNMFLPADLRTGVLGEDLTPKVDELMQDLSLVGVIWSRNPEVMIESTMERRTFLLKIGDIFSQRQYKVTDITRSSVILAIDLDGKAIEYELR